jgi:hypothetical protein
MPNRDEVTRFLGEYPAAVRDMALELRTLIRTTLPDVTEAVDRPGHIVGYSLAPGYSGLICTIIMSKTGVKLGIVDGATLPDPHKLLEGAGKRHKYVAVTQPADLHQDGLEPLLKAAVGAWKART